MPKSANNLIGVFDSGLGGLSVLKELIVDVPGYHYIYLGDTARVPYGDKSAETIYNYTKQAVAFLFKQGCSLVIIACNTASAQALHRLQRDWLPKYYPRRRILGVIRPLAEAIAASKTKRVGIMGTKATIASQAYPKEIAALNPKIKVFSQAAPLLVPLIEEGRLDKPETYLILKSYLGPLQQKKIDTLILACTHYPHLQKTIKKIVGAKINVPDTGKIIAASLKDYLARHDELKIVAGRSKQEFYTTDDPKMFKKMAERLIGRKIETITLATL
jgi:glutamate racemase